MTWHSSVLSTSLDRLQIHTDAFCVLADGGVQLKDDLGSYTDDDGEDASSTGSDADDGQALNPESKAYKLLPSPVRQRLQDLEGEVERLHEENARLKEVCVASVAMQSADVHLNRASVFTATEC